MNYTQELVSEMLSFVLMIKPSKTLKVFYIAFVSTKCKIKKPYPLWSHAIKCMNKYMLKRSQIYFLKCSIA